MNMKRGLVFSLCALALAAYSGQAQAAVKLSLNLHYNDPADPSEGGTFTLVAQTDTAFGISAVNSYLSNINTAGLTFTAGNNQLSGGPYVTAVTGGTNVLYGQDTSAGTLVMNVGRTTGPTNIASDPLKNAVWNNSSSIFTGTFGATRPAFITVGANSTDANVFVAGTTTTPLPAGGSVAAGTVTTIVRGDSLASLGLNTNAAAGLKQGDANRDFSVNFADFLLLQANFNTTGKTWDQGDFNDSANGAVDFADFLLLQANFNTSSPAPISAVPEPATLALGALSACGLLAFRRRQK